MLLRSVGALAAERHECADCHRTPLIGEHIYLFGRAAVCALCRPRHRTQPERSELVRHMEFGHAVRVTARQAA